MSITPVKWNDQHTWEIDVTAPAQPQVSIGRTGEATLIATVQATANPLTASDTQGADNTGLNVAYRVLSKSTGVTPLVGASQVVGKFDFGLVR
jgi:hypothetical protein